ncbi:Cys-tRNA(Pro) deacylase [Bowmanella denitrificans]|uniref:Cys-tRNA(Pro)/Cys-tRNA(Cys) deacylase n=1 Tax=Bowmanella denitrificans TaxID=366582 RepID=A0ABP3GJ44_9ALTE
MTPAINSLQKARAEFRLHQYQHDAGHPSFGLEAAEKLAVTPERVFKTLVAETEKGQLVVAVVPVNQQLNLKQLAKAATCKKAEMAKPDKVQRTTGYVLGGVSPIGQKKALATFVHVSAREYTSIFVSGGRRGLEIELSPDTLLSATGGCFAELV